MKVVLLICLALLAQACRTGGIDVNAKKSHWQQIIDKDIPVGSTRAEIEAWGKARGISFEDTAKLKDMPLTLLAMVERTPADGVVCKEWQFHVMITLSPEGRSTNQYILGAGRCL